MAWSGPGGGGGVPGASPGCGAPRYSSQHISISLPGLPVAVLCAAFSGFWARPRVLFCSISQHTGQVLRLPLGHPAGTVLRFLVFRPGLGSVSPNIAAHRRGSWLYACRRSPVGTSSSPPHLLPMSHSFPARRLSPSPLCVLRFLVFRPAPSPVSPNIAAHRPGFASAPRSSGRYCAAFSGN